MSDLLLEHYMVTAERRALEPIPWPKEWELSASVPDVPHDAPLPKVDVLITTFTAAEKQSLSILSPGHSADSWQFYAHNWSEFEPHFTSRSPAREAKRLGEYATCRINGKTVVLLHSQCHPATDDETMPLRALWRQAITETGCSLAIDTGTAGGVGEDVAEGDVLVTNTCQINCEGQFKDQSFAHQKLVGSWFPTLTQADVDLWQALVNTNAQLLSSVANRDPRLWLTGSDESTDIFAFADPEDSYGVVKADPNARMEEMDLMGLCLACEDLGDKAPRWLSVRCASDPEVPQMSSLEAEKRWAANVYQRYGGDAALGSVEACAVVVAGLK